jgi:hypothetical protein
MNTRSLLPAVLGAFLILMSCEQSKRRSTDPGFLVSKSTLADTLSLKIIQSMEVNEISGISIQIQSKGKRLHYYEYEGDKARVLAAISRSGFNVDGRIADTICRHIPTERLNELRSNLQSDELDESKFFWQANEHNAEVYECIKARVRHTLVFFKDSKTVFHRIEIS